MITFAGKGDWSKTNRFLERALNVVHLGWLDKYGEMGVEALSDNTPKRTGLAKASWSYRIERKKGVASIVWYNSDIEGGYNVAILLQYGHGTKNGKWVEGIDYINPALKPIFESIADSIWKEISES